MRNQPETRQGSLITSRRRAPHGREVDQEPRHRQRRPQTARADVRRLDGTRDIVTDSDSIDGLSNWGRWGADDELDTLNLITDEVRARAAAEARTGRCIAGEAHRTGGEGIAASQRLRRYLVDVLCAGARLGAPSAGEAGAPAPSGSAT